MSADTTPARDGILEAIAQSAVSLLREADPEKFFPEVLETLGKAAKVDRTLLFLLDTSCPGQDHRIAERYLWSAPGIETSEETGKAAEPMAEAGLQSWVDKLSRGEIVTGPTQHFEAPVRKALARDGTRSVAVVPVFVDGAWAGQLGFDSCREERAWSPAEIDALRTMAELVGTAIARARDHQKLERANSIIEHSPTVLFRLKPEEPWPVSFVSANIRHYGYAAAELLAEPTRWSELVEAADRAGVLRAIRLITSGEAEQSRAEFRWRKPDGSCVWFEGQGRAVRDGAGCLVAIEGIVTDVSERKTADRKIELLARTDAVTGLANRAEFLDCLENAIAAGRRRKGDLSVMFLDLDGFKDVNDALGHPVGDELLRAVGRRLLRAVRDSDTVARFGGDEFAVLQTNHAGRRAAQAGARRVCRLLAEPFRIRGKTIHVTASIGIAHYKPGRNGRCELMEHADLALYRAKQDGRNCVRTYAPELDRIARFRAELSTQLGPAIENGEFELHYQPQVELATGRLLGLEALLRWNHPQRGLLLPSQFVAIAEASGTIVAIGKWVLREALRQISRWRDLGLEPPPVAVNVSAGQLIAGGCFDTELAAMLRAWQVSPDALALELTESDLVDMSRKTRSLFQRLREMGVKIAIDDFGTGYSSLNYLRSCQVTHLKIDGTFIKDVTTNPDDAIIVRATVGLARDLGIDCIAEGVETTAQRAFLINVGCRLGQGFAFGRPANTEATARLLSRQGDAAHAAGLRRAI